MALYFVNHFFHIRRMKKQMYYLALTGAMILGAMTGCNKDKPEVAGEIPVNLTADIAVKPTTSLKVANDQWEDADRVGLFMKNAEQALDAPGAVFGTANNVQMSINAAGTLTAASPVMYPAAGNVDFIAYYPHSASLQSGYALPVNVLSSPQQEVLYSNNVINQEATKAAVPLSFRYSLTKIIVNVTDNEYSPLTPYDWGNMEVYIEGMYTQARLQLANGTFTDRQNKQNIFMRRIGNTNSFESLVLPTDEEVVFVINAGMSSYVFRYPLAKTFAAHTCYTLDFVLNFPKIEAVLLNTNIQQREQETGNHEVNTKQMTLYTNQEGDTSISLQGTGTATVIWGDGTPSQTHTIQQGTNTTCTHTYTGAASRVITIIGDNVSYLNCSNNQITGLIAIDNPALKTLYCSNNLILGLSVYSTVLTTLDCSNNQMYGYAVFMQPALAELNIKNNLFNADELEYIFHNLHDNTIEGKTIYISGNPGAATCDKTIATSKGWLVDTN